jgi:hypothetical protein
VTNIFVPTCCCVTLLDDANQLAMVLGESTADADTWTHTPFQYQQNLYSTRNLWVSPQWIRGIIDASNPLARPDWDTEQLIDMAAAQRARDAISTSHQLQTGMISVLLDVQDIAQAIQLWKLEPVEQQESQ